MSWINWLRRELDHVLRFGPHNAVNTTLAAQKYCVKGWSRESPGTYRSRWRGINHSNNHSKVLYHLHQVPIMHNQYARRDDWFEVSSRVQKWSLAWRHGHHHWPGINCAETEIPSNFESLHHILRSIDFEGVEMYVNPLWTWKVELWDFVFEERRENKSGCWGKQFKVFLPFHAEERFSRGMHRLEGRSDRVPTRRKSK